MKRRLAGDRRLLFRGFCVQLYKAGRGVELYHVLSSSWRNDARSPELESCALLLL